MSLHARNRIVALLIAAAAAGCATGPAPSVKRGRVLNWSARTQEVARGPITLHAYAGFTGGEIFQAPAGTGSGADCASSLPGAHSTPLPADRVVFIAVPEGAVACLHTWTDSAYELLWHGEPQIERPSSPTHN
jgi:hypothetical protein